MDEMTTGEAEPGTTEQGTAEQAATSGHLRAAGTGARGEPPDETALRVLLRRGSDGMVPWSQRREDEGRAEGSAVLSAKYDGMVDPAGAEKLGAALAGRLAPLQPDLLLVWQDVEDAVLGFIVARELGVPMIRAYDAEGIVACSGEVPSRARVVAVTDAVRDSNVLLALRSLVERSDGTLLGVGVLDGSGGGPFAVPVVALVPGSRGR